jgi:hypothetical protein
VNGFDEIKWVLAYTGLRSWRQFQAPPTPVSRS